MSWYFKTESGKYGRECVVAHFLTEDLGEFVSKASLDFLREICCCIEDGEPITLREGDLEFRLISKEEFVDFRGHPHLSKHGIVTMYSPDGFKTEIEDYLLACETAELIRFEDGVLTITEENCIIPENFFAGNASITQAVIPRGTILGKRAFNCCRKLTSLILEDGVRSVGEMAFFDCYNLESVTIGEEIGWIESWAFLHCNNLRKVTFPRNLKDIRIERNSFVDGLRPEKVVLPEGEMKIRDCAFRKRGMNYLVIPETVQKIGNAAFADCWNLKQVVIRQGLRTIGDYAFAGCRNLEEVVLPASLQRLSGRAFMDCTSLKRVVIPPNIRKLRMMTFRGCTNLEAVVIPETVDVHPTAFEDCPNVKIVIQKM